MPYERELQVALEAVALAGKLILDHYAHFKIIPDAAASISTDTDRQAQEIILSHLHSAFPRDALCAEETIAGFANVPRAGPRLWIVDPIDGTRGFARKTGEFSVMVAFTERGQIAVGVVFEPALERLTYATRGAGCWRKDGMTFPPHSCRVSNLSRLEEAVVTQSHSRGLNRPSREIQALRPARVHETYSAGIKLALVARAQADLYLNTYDTYHDWDICAGQILVEEAGGLVTNLLGEAPCYGSPGAVQRHGLLASNGTLHATALRALREM